MEQKNKIVQQTQAKLNPLSTQLIECITKEDSIGITSISSALTVQKAAEGTKLIRLKKVLGPANLLKTVMVLIWDSVNYFNLPEGKNMNENQVINTAQFLIEDYPNFSLEDFALCFRQGKRGKYGKNFSTFDGQILMGWLQAYDLERDEVFVHENKIDTPKEPILPKVIIQDLYEKFSAPLEQDKKSKEEEFKKAKQDWLRKNAQSNT